MPFVSPEPHVYIEIDQLGHACRAWIRAGGEYVEVSSMISAFRTEAIVGRRTTATLTFEGAASGRPEGVQ